MKRSQNNRPLIHRCPVRLDKLVLLLGSIIAAPACLSTELTPSRNISDAVSPTTAPTAVDPMRTHAATPEIAAEEPEMDAGAWLGQRTAAGETHAAIVASLEPGRTFARSDPDAVINPASLVKLATSLIALRDLGAGHRFKIDVYADGSLRGDGIFRGDIYFSGSDPVFTDASSAAVAKALADRGIKRLDGNVFVSKDFSYGFSDSPEASAKLLAKNLELKKVPPAGVADKPVGSVMFTFHSQPLYKILLYQNTFSSNFVAHRLGNAVGGVDKLTRYLTEVLNLPTNHVKLETASGLGDNGMTPRGIFAIIRELDREIRRQGHELVDILPVAAENTSTLKRRLSGSQFERAVVGKTGTLSAHDGGPGIASLAGVAYTRKGGPIVFVLMSQGKDVRRHKEMHDEFLRLVLDGNGDPEPFKIDLPRDLLQTDETYIESRDPVHREEK